MHISWLNIQVVELKEAEVKSLKESERLEKEIAEVQELKVIKMNSLHLQSHKILWFLTAFHLFQQKKISTMTANEYFEKHPELKKKFDDEIRNDYWGYWSLPPALPPTCCSSAEFSCSHVCWIINVAILLTLWSGLLLVWRFEEMMSKNRIFFVRPQRSLFSDS
jgi:hypothetical protein